MLINRDETLHYDIVVVGGGSAGVAAAVSAAKLGKKVALVEKYGFFGGAATISSVQTFCGFYDQNQESVVQGIGLEVLEKLNEIGFTETRFQKRSGNTIVLFNQEDLKVALDATLQKANVSLYLHSNVFSVSVQESRIVEIAATHRGGILRLQANQFIDTSGDGSLIQKSGANVHLSAPSQRQGSTLVMQIGGVSNTATLSPVTLAAAINDVVGPTEQVDSNVAVRIENSGAVMLLAVDEHFDVFDVRESTNAEIHARKKSHQYLKALRVVPGWEQAYLANTGPQIGIRESVRMKGKEIVAHDSITNATKLPDTGIARCGWPIEDHSIPGVTSYTEIKDKGWFHIPLGAIESENIKNLWAGGRVISADSSAFTSIRVMGTAFATGHAAGVAASISVDNISDEVEVKQVQEILTSQGALL